MDRFSIQEDIISTLDGISGLPLENEGQMFDVRCAQAHIYSSVTGGKIDDRTPLNAHHWWTNVRQCVRFGDAIEAIMKARIVDAFLEISPHPVLTASIRECYDFNNFAQPLILPTLKRNKDEQTTLIMSLAQLSYSPDVWRQYLDSRSAQPSHGEKTSLETFPLYPFNKIPCWYESKECAMKRLANRLSKHPLLGVRQWTQQTSATWKSLINLKLPEFAFLRDHKIRDSVLFPVGGFLELALAACRQLLSASTGAETTPPIAFEQVEFSNVLLLTEHELIEVFTHVVMPMHEWSIYSRPWSAAEKNCMRASGMAAKDIVNSFTDPQTLNTYSLNEFTLHARGRIDIGPHLNIYATSNFQPINKTDAWRVLNPVRTYTHLSSRGYQYGPSFQVMESIKYMKSQAIGCIRQDKDRGNDVRYHLHPIIFHVIDWVLLIANEPALANKIMHDTMEHVQRGLFKPIEPTTIYEPSEVIEAFTQYSLDP
ncbi:unnamed protein product, partial [Rotaria sp. Silwood1]